MLSIPAWGSKSVASLSSEGHCEGAILHATLSPAVEGTLVMWVPDIHVLCIHVFWQLI